MGSSRNVSKCTGGKVPRNASSFPLFNLMRIMRMYPRYCGKYLIGCVYIIYYIRERPSPLLLILLNSGSTRGSEAQKINRTWFSSIWRRLHPPQGQSSHYFDFSKMMRIAAGLLAVAPLAAAQSPAWGQCKYFRSCPRRDTNSSRRRTRLDRIDFLRLWFSLYIQQ